MFQLLEKQQEAYQAATQLETGLSFLDKTKAMFCRSMSMMVRDITPQLWPKYVKDWTIMTIDYLERSASGSSTPPPSATVSAPPPAGTYVASVQRSNLTAQGQLYAPNAQPPPAHQVHTSSFLAPAPLPLPLPELGYNLNVDDYMPDADDFVQYLQGPRPVANPQNVDQKHKSSNNTQQAPQGDQ